MGKKQARKFNVLGTTQAGPNRQNKPSKPQQEPDSSSEDSFVLDSPVESYYLPDSGCDSDNETPMDKPVLRAQVKQVYKNSAAGNVLYGPVTADSNVVSSKAPASEIDYKIEFVLVEKKKKQQYDEHPAWIESMYSRNRNPPPRSDRPPTSDYQVPLRPDMLKPPPISYIFNARLASNQFPSAANVEIRKEIEDEWWEDVLDRFAPSVATSSKQDCETESIVSSAAWDNNKISFR